MYNCPSSNWSTVNPHLPGATRMARRGIRLVHGLTKSTLITYFSGMKIDPKNAFLHAFFLFCLSCSFQNLSIWPGGGTRMARGGIRLVHRLTKNTLITYFSGMKKDPKYAFLHAFFLICLSCFSKFVYMTKNTPFFSQLCTFLHPLTMYASTVPGPKKQKKNKNKKKKKTLKTKKLAVTVKVRGGMQLGNIKNSPWLKITILRKIFLVGLYGLESYSIFYVRNVIIPDNMNIGPTLVFHGWYWRWRSLVKPHWFNIGFPLAILALASSAPNNGIILVQHINNRPATNIEPIIGIMLAQY